MASSRCVSAPAIGDDRAKVLWIEDDPGTLASSAKLLAVHGFHVDHVLSGADGLTRARIDRYDVILLDLRLPDMWGLAVLERLLADGVGASIVILTGFGSIDAAVRALRLGAVDFREKPLIGDDLVDCVRVAVHSCTANRPPATGSPEPSPRQQGESHAIRALRQSLELSPPESPPALIALLMNTAVRNDLSVPVFVECARWLRSVLNRCKDTNLSALVAQVRGGIDALPRLDKVADPRTLAAMIRLEHAPSRVSISERDIANELGIDPAHLGRLLRRETGLTFREWRWGLIIREAAQLLRHTREQVAQIAYRVGYDHPSQLDRDFRHVLGITPTEFRRLAQEPSSLRSN